MTITHEWVADGVTTPTRTRRPRFPYATGSSYWERELGLGNAVQSVLSDVGPLERGDMESEGVKSNLNVPIFVSGEWWGFIGFDDCSIERAWDTAEVSAFDGRAREARSLDGPDRASPPRGGQDRFRALVVEQAPAVVSTSTVSTTKPHPSI